MMHDHEHIADCSLVDLRAGHPNTIMTHPLALPTKKRSSAKKRRKKKRSLSLPNHINGLLAIGSRHPQLAKMLQKSYQGCCISTLAIFEVINPEVNL